MIDIIVRRYSGDRPGRDIVNGLIGSVDVALRLGMSELDSKAQPMQAITIEAVYRDGVRKGQLVRVHDTIRGTWIGKVTGVSHKYENGVLASTIQMTRPML